MSVRKLSTRLTLFIDVLPFETVTFLEGKWDLPGPNYRRELGVRGRVAVILAHQAEWCPMVSESGGP